MKILKKCILMTAILVFILVCKCYAETVDTNVSPPYDVKLGSDGEVTWSIDADGKDPSLGLKYIYKKFQVKLEKRYLDTVGTTYDWKDFGSVKTITVSDNDPAEYVTSVEISSPGYYRAKVRAMTVENAYSEWSDVSDEAAFDSSTTNISVTNGSSIASNYGPGTVYSGSSGMQVANPYNNYGGASNIIGTNGQYITSNGYGSAYIYDNSYQNNIGYNGQGIANVGVGPGVNNGATMDTYAPGPGTNTQVITGMSNNVGSPNYFNINNAGQIVQSGPSQSGGSMSAYAQQNWSKEVGWHADANGFYYYQGNGVYLRNQWYLINNSYYRFNENAYALISKWYKDPNNNGWYYMGADGRMLTGWQFIDGIWYYLSPDRGTNYGVMYCNCSMNIGGKYYAFNSEGGCILNGYYNGNYYGADGSRQY